MNSARSRNEVACGHFGSLSDFHVRCTDYNLGSDPVVLSSTSSRPQCLAMTKSLRPPSTCPGGSSRWSSARSFSESSPRIERHIPRQRVVGRVAQHLGPTRKDCRAPTYLATQTATSRSMDTLPQVGEHTNQTSPYYLLKVHRPICDLDQATSLRRRLTLPQPCRSQRH